MVGSEMDGDRPRALAKRRSTKKQPQMGGASAAAAAALAFHDGDRDASVVGRWDKEKARGRREAPERGYGAAEGNDGEPAQSPAATTTPSSTCRKRAKLNGKKPMENCIAVDAASVPRKSRSAAKKRSHHSVSPLLPNLKVRKKHCYTPNGTDVSCLNGGARIDHNLLFDSTEDEKEVIEALFELSEAAPLSLEAEDKEDKKVLQDILSDNADSPTATKVSTDVNISLFSTSCEVEGLHSTVFQKIATDCGCQSSKPDLNGEHDSCKATPLGNSVQSNVTLSNNAALVLTSSELSRHYFENGELKPPEYDRPATLHAHKLDNNILPFGSQEPANIMQHEVQLHEQNSTGNTGKYASALQGGVSSVAYKKPTMSSSSGRSAICPGFAKTSLKPSSNCITSGTKKLALWPTNAASSRKNCAIHICISHLIRDHQKKESETKSKLKSNLGTLAASETPKMRNDVSSLASTAPGSSLVERNLFDVRNEALSNGVYLNGQHSSILPENSAQQKQHPRDFPLFPTASGVRGSFLHPQAPQQATLPFHFTQIPQHISQYSDKLSAAAKPQANLQVMPYFSNPFLVPPSPASGTNLHQQYQMWQAQVARCSSTMGIGVLQNGQLQDPSSFFRMSAQSSPSIFVGAQGASYRPPNAAQEQMQLLSTPPMTTSMGRYNQEHHHQSGG